MRPGTAERRRERMIRRIGGDQRMNEKEDLWWMLECPKSGEPCYCKEECMYLRQKSREQEEPNHDA